MDFALMESSTLVTQFVTNQLALLKVQRVHVVHVCTGGYTE